MELMLLVITREFENITLYKNLLRFNINFSRKAHCSIKGQVQN